MILRPAVLSYVRAPLLEKTIATILLAASLQRPTCTVQSWSPREHFCPRLAEVYDLSAVAVGKCKPVQIQSSTATAQLSHDKSR